MNGAKQPIHIFPLEGILQIKSLQSPGRKQLTVAQFIRGHEVQPGQIFRS